MAVVKLWLIPVGIVMFGVPISSRPSRISCEGEVTALTDREIVDIAFQMERSVFDILGQALGGVRDCTGGAIAWSCRAVSR